MAAGMSGAHCSQSAASARWEPARLAATSGLSSGSTAGTLTLQGCLCLKLMSASVEHTSLPEELQPTAERYLETAYFLIVKYSES